jgi:hypothetical protein
MALEIPYKREHVSNNGHLSVSVLVYTAQMSALYYPENVDVSERNVVSGRGLGSTHLGKVQWQVLVYTVMHSRRGKGGFIDQLENNQLSKKNYSVSMNVYGIWDSTTI